MKTPPSISIVIPTYKRLDMLAELTQALLPQLAAIGDRVEMLVIDNCPDGSARETVAEMTGDVAAVRYIHEPRAGVVHARNTGVTAATGDYILFLDDDEVPSAHWLSAFAALADREVVAAFGRIVPRYEGTPEIGLKPLLDRLFSREYPDPTGADIVAHYPELGTGNALFHKARCFDGDTPFDARFNERGGEDIFLIKSLVDRGDTLSWCPDGLVEELVPAARMKAQYLKERRYNQGQQRCLFLAASPKAGDRIKVVAWMGVGLVQTVLYSVKAVIAGLRGAPQAADYKVSIHGGLGKMFWWRGTAGEGYAGGS